MTLRVERPYVGQSIPPKAGELGNTLSKARRAHAISLEDVERDTHVSRRYLQALENEDFSIFPAPVYARGFLRTYSRYLGLNPDELLRVFPNGDLTVDITPLPTVSRPPDQLINVNWLVAGLVAIFLLGAGLLLLRGGSNPSTQSPSTTLGAQSATSSTSSTTAGGSVQAPVTTGDAQVQGKAISPIRPGQYPDFVGADKASALSVLNDNGFNYLLIEVASNDVPKGIVISQSPAPASKADPGSAITLTVSSGATPDGASGATGASGQ